MHPQTKLLVLILLILITQFYCTQIFKHLSGYDCNTTLNYISKYVQAFAIPLQ